MYLDGAETLRDDLDSRSPSSAPASIGTSIAMAAVRAGDEASGWDLDPAAAARAAERGGFAAAGSLPRPSTGPTSSSSATPIATLAAVVAEALEAAPGAVVTDAGSVKAPVVAEVTRLAPGLASRFVGGHPMGGSERSGPDHASASVVDGIVWVLTPDAGTDPGAVDRLEAWVRSIGARPVRMDAARHDRLVGFVSHLPQVASTALMGLVADEEADEPEILLLAAGGFRDLTRLASSNPGLWSEILLTNREAIVDAIDLYVARLSRLRDLIGGEAAAGGARGVRGGEGGPPHPCREAAGPLRRRRDPGADPGPARRAGTAHRRAGGERREHRGPPDRALPRGRSRDGASHGRRDGGRRGRRPPWPPPTSIPRARVSSLEVAPGGRLAGTVRVPGDKSIAHRWLILAATARGRSRLVEVPPSLDVRSTAACLATLYPSARASLEGWSRNDAAPAEGHGSTWNRGVLGWVDTPLEVEGEGRGAALQPDADLDCGNSGTSMRLLAGIARRSPDPRDAHRRSEPAVEADGAGGRAAAGDGRPRGDDGRTRPAWRSRAATSTASTT